uniref:Uncharacterized protein n=1 Tax=Staphylococcus haemolyticus TaxID=1283 RepID=A0A142BMT9_STAHA|nr:Hypothetical Protein [Staphylococcus haemolyticus]
MKKVKSYLKNIQNNEEYQKDIEFLEKKSNGREDKKLILDICFLSTIPLISIYITLFFKFFQSICNFYINNYSCASFL